MFSFFRRAQQNQEASLQEKLSTITNWLHQNHFIEHLVSWIEAEEERTHYIRLAHKMWEPSSQNSSDPSAKTEDKNIYPLTLNLSSALELGSKARKLLWFLNFGSNAIYKKITSLSTELGEALTTIYGAYFAVKIEYTAALEEEAFTELTQELAHAFLRSSVYADASSRTKVVFLILAIARTLYEAKKILSPSTTSKKTQASLLREQTHYLTNLFAHDKDAITFLYRHVSDNIGRQTPVETFTFLTQPAPYPALSFFFYHEIFPKESFAFLEQEEAWPLLNKLLHTPSSQEDQHRLIQSTCFPALDTTNPNAKKALQTYLNNYLQALNFIGDKHRALSKRYSKVSSTYLLKLATLQYCLEKSLNLGISKWHQNILAPSEQIQEEINRLLVIYPPHFFIPHDLQIYHSQRLQRGINRNELGLLKLTDLETIYYANLWIMQLANVETLFTLADILMMPENFLKNSNSDATQEERSTTSSLFLKNFLYFQTTDVQTSTSQASSSSDSASHASDSEVSLILYDRDYIEKFSPLDVYKGLKKGVLIDVPVGVSPTGQKRNLALEEETPPNAFASSPSLDR